ncbi:class I SAM-dependent methyltransferase [Agromyces albus]|uniref:class I SAM-dependent methyltransferase n=1 Tax=Agromyces albus TaxID=205332 RepID=UPI0027D78149|nr:class I SAM-dependent methyltransferase [Agromyces albus]
MSGHGIDDVALIHLGARSVTGVDYSPTAASAAQRRADGLGVDCRYVTATLPASGLMDDSADLVYTGKGALIWVDDLEAWLTEMGRLLRPGGHLFIYEAHPLTPLWSWDPDKVEVRRDRGYFARSHVNDSFPAGGAVEYQRTFAETIMAISGSGFEILHLEEHPEPFWRPGGMDAAAWNGQCPECVQPARTAQSLSDRDAGTTAARTPNAPASRLRRPPLVGGSSLGLSIPRSGGFTHATNEDVRGARFRGRAAADRLRHRWWRWRW